jgi:acetylornithine/succinyldiaminopimelate/putrescine aminotransferase
VIGRIPVTEAFGSYVNTDTAAVAKGSSDAHKHAKTTAGNTTAAAAATAGFDTLLTSDVWLVRYVQYSHFER